MQNFILPLAAAAAETKAAFRDTNEALIAQCADFEKFRNAT